MTLTFVNYTDGLSLDDIEITLDASDNNPVSNWNFEDGLDGWQTKGTVTLTNAADTGSQAVQLADQSECTRPSPCSRTPTTLPLCA